MAIDGEKNSFRDPPKKTEYMTCILDSGMK